MPLALGCEWNSVPLAGSGPRPSEEVAFPEQLVWELECLLAAPSPRNSKPRSHVGQEPVGTRPALASPEAASAADHAPGESFVEQNICIVQSAGAGAAWPPQELYGRPPVLGLSPLIPRRWGLHLPGSTFWPWKSGASYGKFRQMLLFPASCGN